MRAAAPSSLRNSLMPSSSWRPHDPDDGAKGDHFRSGGAGDGVGEGADASGPFSGRGYPTIAKIVPLCSAVTSRQFGGITSPCDDVAGWRGAGAGLSVMAVPF
jgi:hypothetical protein